MPEDLILLVGRESSARRSLAHELIDRGYAVVMCSGPPGCVLAHDDRCALVDRADVAVVLTGWHEPMGAPFLAACARSARHVVFAHDPPFDAPPGSVVAPGASVASIAAATEALARTASRP